ncbi:MAG TPA: CHRD domain-containing protein [Vicinamibacterales bacterium]|nr:CHRD domain-containing protein [Vicinamibacterales bacterium]
MTRHALGYAAIALFVFAAGCGDDDDNPNGPSLTGPIVFSVPLSAANEVPPIGNEESTARGTATITMNVPRDGSGNPNGSGTIDFAVQLTNFPAGSVVRLAHIHLGAAGVNGGIEINTGLSAANAVTLTNGSGSFSFTGVAVDATRALQFYATPSQYYFNVHSALNPGGVVRGQLALQ